MAAFDRFKSFLTIISLCVFLGWSGIRLFAYFTHQEVPTFTVREIEEQGTYGKQLAGHINALSSYKIGNIVITLDGQPLIEEWVKAKEFDIPVTIDTTKFPDGEHTLVVTACDTSYHQNKTVQTFHIIVDNAPLHTAFIEQDHTVYQGKTLHLKVATNKKEVRGTVTLGGNKYTFTPTTDGSTTVECFIPIDCEENPTEHMLSAEMEDLAKNKQKLSCHVTIKAFEFTKQKGFVVPDEKVEQERQAGASMQILGNALQEALAKSPAKKMWNGAFIYPIDVQRMSTPFGEQRVNQVSGRYMHKGVDLVNRPRSLIWAAQHGTVIIKERFFTTGNTVVLDHGLGVFTLYGHLDSFADIEVGQTIKKGAPLGKLGMTGYANGYHLHWELRINRVAVDPLEWLTKIY